MLLPTIEGSVSAGPSFRVLDTLSQLGVRWCHPKEVPVPMTPALQAAIDGFAPVAESLGWSSPGGCFDRCVIASEMFRAYLAKFAELDSEIVQLAGPPEFDNPDPAWTYYPREEWAHVVVRVDGVYVDWTARQFDTGASFPLVSAEHGWAEAWADQEPCPHPVTRLDRKGRVYCDLCLERVVVTKEGITV